jgi:hypothetical protein
MPLEYFLSVRILCGEGTINSEARQNDLKIERNMAGHDSGTP